jgi:phosphoglycolate phosphatase
MVEQAMGEVGAGPADTVIVGDSSYDMLMGRAAGVGTIGVSWGFQPVDVLRAAGADLIVDTAADLGAALDRLAPASLSGRRVPISPV